MASTKIILAAALAGTAAAGCPLSVEISGATNHIAHVAVTNTGNEVLTVFKGNTVLNEHPTLDLLVSDEDGKALPFEGMYVNYKRNGIAAHMFQTLQPGETVTASVNAAKTYNLGGVAKAKATALQGFHYVVGSTAPTALKDTLFCESTSSNSVTLTPDQSTATDDHILTRADRSDASSSRIKKRDVTYSSCTTAQTTILQTSVTDAIAMAGKAYTAAATAAYYFTTWFKSTAEETLVRTIYNDVANVRTTSPRISCVDIDAGCTSGDALLYTIPSAKVIVPCPSNGFYSFPELSPTCADFDYDKAGSILHEMTHLYGTDDWAYGPTAAKALTAAKAANNADTYEMYAGSVRLGGCN
ncbi:hypothetical protein BX600DRAFT_157524 [Xylariales sp. PMI_506]|nr:hypothetical protein BX600DRAFT_157524 [Xylariales sp. PMI_506]